MLTLVQSLAISKVDYCISVLVGVSRQLQNGLQSILNAAARIVFSVRIMEHVSPLLRKLHWLQIPQRIQFRLGDLVFRCLHGTAPPYLADYLRLDADVVTCVLSTQGRYSFRQLVDRYSVTGRFTVVASMAWNQWRL